MTLDPSGSVMDNEGPHCRNCHTGSSQCNQCHGDTGTNFGYELLTEGKSVAAGDAFAHTAAVTTVSNKCIDGGFSWPHRTLGADLLKDELYGVNFDGSAVAVGGTRNTTLSDGDTLDLANYPLLWGQSKTTEASYNASASAMVMESGEQLTNAGGVEGMDSVCIDCHGNATTYQGDNPAIKSAAGWELLWKGLP